MREQEIILFQQQTAAKLMGLEGSVQQLAVGIQWCQNTVLQLAYILEKNGVVTKEMAEKAMAELKEKQATVEAPKEPEVKDEGKE